MKTKIATNLRINSKNKRMKTIKHLKKIESTRKTK